MFNSLSRFSCVSLLALLPLLGTVPSNGQTTEPITKAESDARNLVVMAQVFYEKKQYDLAIESATNATKILLRDHRPWTIIGNSYLSQWKMKSASEAYAKAAEINPRHRGLWYLKAYADRSRNAREESIAAAKKAIEIDPNYAEAYAIMAESLAMGSKDNKGAIEAFRTALKLKPGLVSASEGLGMQLSVAGDKKGAEEVYRKALELDPQKMACRFPLGRILVQQGRLIEARELWNGRKSDETNTFPLFITLLERAEKKKAATDKLAASPDDPQALMEMGFVEMEGEFWSHDGRQLRALEYFKKAITKEPDLIRAQFGICKAYVELADQDKKVSPDLDRELKKLREMDAKLAAEIDEYRKSFKGSFKVSTDKIDQ